MAGQTAVQVTHAAPDKWLDTVTVAQVPVPAPAPGEVLVNVKLRPINPADTLAIMGLYPAFNTLGSYPCVPGMEGMGVVSALGDGVTSLKVGQRVTATLWPKFAQGVGLYQEYVTMPADALSVVPDDITDDAAACAVINPVTAIGLLEGVGDVPRGEHVIITAAGSSVSRMLLGLCKDRGIKTIGLVRRKDLGEQLLKEGLSAYINTTEEGIAERVMSITNNKGAWAAFDCMCGDTTAQLCKALRVRGKVMQYGAMAGTTYTLSVGDSLFKAVRTEGYWVNIELQGMSREQREERIKQVWDLYRRGIISSSVGQTFPLAEAPAALKAHTEACRTAKVLLAS